MKHKNLDIIREIIITMIEEWRIFLLRKYQYSPGNMKILRILHILRNSFVRNIFIIISVFLNEDIVGASRVLLDT